MFGENLDGRVDLSKTALTDLLDQFVEGDVGLELGELSWLVFVPLLEFLLYFLDEGMSDAIFLEFLPEILVVFVLFSGPLFL